MKEAECAISDRYSSATNSIRDCFFTVALSGAICEKSNTPIEFFFLDEGFGALDETLVDTVMDSLEKLKNTHFSIGLISHVAELKHRINAKILVQGATEERGSVVSLSI